MSLFARWKQYTFRIDLKIFHERRPNPIKQYTYASLSLRCKALLGLVDTQFLQSQLHQNSKHLLKNII